MLSGLNFKVSYGLEFTQTRIRSRIILKAKNAAKIASNESKDNKRVLKVIERPERIFGDPLKKRVVR